ncbi:phosphoserine aminotransferase [Rhizomicrobium sp. SCGC AG-212-E05]|nr:phosphoserine aminotransferase [Rhizomicrobium sp. SCGC AG-212-E05]
MTEVVRPAVRPARPFFSSGPCAKRPGWTHEALKGALVGRSHRSKPGKAKLSDAILRTKKLLNLPEGYRCGIVPASDTGAVEMALWSLLGPRPVDLFAWESFSEDWVTDTVKQLKIADTRTFKAPYGQLPDMTQYNPAHDAVFVWNGTTSGVKVANGDWIPDSREGLTICDATSAAFAMELPWDKLDVVTFSWQKVLGGEAAHGMLILSPRAVARLESHTPSWPMPKIFRMTKGGKIVEGIFEGETINTPSMVAVEDYLDALSWAESVGGLKGLIQRSNANLKVLEDWAAKSDWAGFLAQDKAIRSNTSVCIKITDPWFESLSDEAKADAAKKIATLLDKEGVALDIAGYRAAPAGLRIWCGATVDQSDLEALTPWLDWAWAQVKGQQAKA